MNKIITTLTVLLVSAAAVSAQSPAEVWTLVCDGSRSVPLSEVVCIMTADNEDVFSVMLNDSSIEGVTSVSFKKSSGITENFITSETGKLLEANGVIHIMNCRPGSHLIITDLRGTVIIDRTIEDSDTEIDIRHFMSGTYIASIGNSSIKFLKK